MKLIPFGMVIPDAEQDKKLPEKLKAELPGILNWAIEGCLAWQRDGLNEPEDVTAATADYRSEMDVIGAFLEECCERVEISSVAASDLYARYQKWVEQNGEHPVNQRRFGMQLTERGIGRKRGTGGQTYRTGIALRDE